MSQSALSEGLRAVETEIAAGRSDRALELCQQLTTRFPRALAAQRALGEVYLTLRKPREALGALDRALSGNPEDARAYCARAIVQQIQGDPTAALAWYRRACDITPDDQVLRGAYAELAAHLRQPPYVPTRAGLARLYLRGDLFEHALREWEAILAEQPGLLEAQVGLAETLWRAGYIEAAAERCQRILANAPSCVKALLILAAVEHDGGREEEADRLARRASELDPEARIGRALYADRLAAGDVALRARLLGEPRPVRPPSVPLSRPTPAHGLQARSQPSSGPVASRAGAPFSQPLAGAGGVPPAQQQPSALPPDFHTIFAETEYMLWGHDEDDPTGTTAALFAPSPATPAGPGTPPAVPPAMAGSTPPAARGDTSARLAAVIPALQQQGGSLDETEVRAKVNFINWLQAQGARARGATGAFPAAAPASSPPAPPPSAPAISPPPPAAPPPASAAAAGSAGGDRRARLTNPLPASSLPTGPLPPPSPEALRQMFAELGGDTASSRIVEGEVVAVNDADAPRAMTTGPGSHALDTDEQVAIETERVTALLGPQTRNRRRDTLVPAGMYDPTAAAPPDDTTAHQEGASAGPVTLEALEQQFTGSGFQSFELRPGELAALAASSGATGGDGERAARGAIATRPLGDTASAESAAPAAEAEPEPEAPAPTPATTPATTPEPADYPARLGRARHHREEGRLTEALADYRLVLKNAPDLLPEVIADLNELLAEHSEQPELHRLLGDARIREGDYLSAIESYNRAVALAHAQNQNE